MAWTTLITDASFDSPGVAGWGAWAKADGAAGSFTQSGVIELVKVQTNNDAEMAAALYGLQMSVAYAPGHNVLFQSDSMHALRVFKEELGLREKPHVNGLAIRGNIAQPLSEVQSFLVYTFADVAKRNGITVVLRHVKGHRVFAGGRNWCNEACDRSAKAAMRHAREVRPFG